MTDDEKMTLWIGAFRYHLGRMTYAVGLFCELLIKEWDGLPEKTQNIIRKELDEEFKRDDEIRKRNALYGESMHKPLGHDCDRNQWEKVRELWITAPEMVTGYDGVAELVSEAPSPSMQALARSEEVDEG